MGDAQDGEFVEVYAYTRGVPRGAEGGLAPPPSTQTYTGRPKRKL